MKKRTFIILFLSLLIASSAFCHPHIFLTNRIQVEFNKDGPAGFQVSWLADDFSSAGLTDGYDENENGTIDPAELKIFERDSVTNLKQYQFFTHITIDRKPFEVKFVKNFKAQLLDGKIEYSFFIPCHIKASDNQRTITVAQYDSSYFSFISFSETNPATLVKADSFQTSINIAENKTVSYYFDMVHPFEMTLRFAKK